MSPSIVCPECLEPISEFGDVETVCPHCRTSYHAACLARVKCLVVGCPPPPPPPEPESPTWRTRLIELLIVMAIIAVLAAIAVPNFHSAPYRANTRACYANQKTVVGAIEMYNLDKNTRRTTLDGAFFLSLKSGGYLQSIPQDPGQGPGSSSNYKDTNANNGIRCEVHGTIQ